ncbi:MAG: hypothetical protein IJB85_04850 [Clostridia bacterium]|nr:hypothetical protein [Clostridia bacterium]
MKNKILWTIILIICLLLPAAALAVTEGAVEAAPGVEMESIAIVAPEISYLPDGSYYAGYDDWFPAWENAQEWVESKFDGECYHDVEQRPRMTAGESARAKALLEKVRAGEIAYQGESILNQMEDVIVGVYALAPDDYAGEKAFVILPGPCMTDEQILAVIDAYHQLGLVFDPHALNERNCARGGGIETNRFLTEEEGERYRLLARLIEHGLLDISFAGEAQAIQPKLDSRYFCGLPDFTIRPYRAMADEEFVAMLVDLGYHDMTGEIDHDEIEKESRMVANSRLGTSLSMELGHVYHEGSYVLSLYDQNGKRGYDWDTPARRSCGAYFTYHTPDGILVHVNTAFDWETKKLVDASAMHHRDDTYGNLFDEIEHAPSHDAIMEEIAIVEKELGLSDLAWHVLYEDETWTNWGACIPVRAQVAESEWMTVYIGKDDGKAHGYELSGGMLVEDLSSDELPVNG